MPPPVWLGKFGIPSLYVPGAHTAPSQSPSEPLIDSVACLPVWGDESTDGDEHPASTAMAKMAANGKDSLIWPILVLISLQMDSDICSDMAAFIDSSK
jgi:hypothetical protein